MSFILISVLASCGASDDPGPGDQIPAEVDLAIIESTFGDRLSLENPYNYQNQNVPNYINEDNTASNQITNQVATLGRVLFYDKNLSSNNTISCSSCHQQAFAFVGHRSTLAEHLGQMQQ